ncbi:MAG: hypothetical protein HY289_06720 [Planctomycetes bacterium]|nr:hypothetical protein [Planctomycetota bacterium]
MSTFDAIEHAIYDPFVQQSFPVKDARQKFWLDSEFRSFAGKKDPRSQALGYWPRAGELTFRESTAIRYVIVFPDTVGGASDDYVYLTTSNRAEQGVEAHIAYFAQQPPDFYIFDFSIGSADPGVPAGRLARQVAVAKLGDYVFPITVAGLPRNGILVINQTRRVQPQHWMNSVFLGVVRNGVTQRYDAVYTHSYCLFADDDQQPQRNGFWGPEIEAFFPFTKSINAMGFTQAMWYQDGARHGIDNTNSEKHDDIIGLKISPDGPQGEFLVR